jgi:hypothetical protein
MIIVLNAALISEIFAIYLIIKAVTFNEIVQNWMYLDFSIWLLFVVVPSIVAIYSAAGTTSCGKKLGNLLGKYSNYCKDDAVSIKVTH